MSTITIDQPDYPLLFITPTEARDRDGDVAVTESGAVRRVPFDGGQAFYIEGETTNIFTNPLLLNTSTSSGTRGFSFEGGDESYVSDDGENVLRVTRNGDNDFAFGFFGASPNRPTLSSGEWLTFSCDVRSPDGSAESAALGLGDTVGPNEDIGPEWKRISISMQASTFMGSIIPTAYSRVPIDSAPAGSIIEFRRAQLEKKAYATTFTHGDMGVGYSWSGTANRSSSVREASRVYIDYPQLPVDTGSFYIRWQAEPVPQQYGQYIGGLGSIGGATERVLVAYITEQESQFVRTRPSNHNHGPLAPTSKAHRNVYVEYTEESTASDFREGGGRIDSGREFGDMWSSNRVSLGGSGHSSTLPLPINGHVAAMIVYDRPLTEAEVSILDAIPTSELTWGRIGSRITRPAEVRPLHPSYRSAVFSISHRVYKTDSLNQSREDISMFISSVDIDSDIDREAGVTQCSVSSIADVIDDGDWIAPYITYAPETGDRIDVQMGLYLIDSPEITYDGSDIATVGATGIDRTMLISMRSLETTFYTPENADPISDIKALLQLASSGFVGPNLVQNPSFESHSDNVLTSWATNGIWQVGSGSISFVVSSQGYPSGERAWGASVSPNQPAGTYAYTYQDIPLGEGMVRSKCILSGMFLPAHREHRGWLRVRFMDAGGVFLDDLTEISTDRSPRTPGYWTRETAHGVIPENAAAARIYVTVQDVASNPTTRRSSWDDISFQVISGEPIPDNLISLPSDQVFTTTRIQSETKTSYLAAINDRWLASGYLGLFANMSGVLMARRDMTSGEDTEVMVLRAGDIRIAGEVRIVRDASERYNTVYATKEDTENGIIMTEVAVNRDPNDPWSIHGEFGAIPISIVNQDAVDAAALKATAESTLAEAMLHEEVEIELLPSPLLFVGDIIRIDMGNKADGRWMVARIEWGTSYDNPLVVVTAKRSARR